MAIVWTKYWAGSDDGTILKGIDLRNIQDDLAVVQTVDDVLSIPGQTQGDILYFNGSDWVRLGAGTSGQVLRTQGAGSNPIWGDPTDLSISSQTIGDTLYFNGTDWIRLPAGTAGQLLQSNGAAAPSWVNAPAGVQGSGIASFLAINGTSGSTSGTANVTSYTEVFDTGADFADPTFTAPQTGIYLFTCYAMIHNGVNQAVAELYINSVTYRVGSAPTSANSGVSGSLVASLSSGQTAIFKVGISSGSGTWTADDAKFSGTLLS